MGAAIGWLPNGTRVLLLARDGDFVLNLRATGNSAIPDGFGADLRLFIAGAEPGVDEPTVVWSATVDANVISWRVPNADVQSAIQAGVKAWRLHLLDADGNDLLWDKGSTQYV